MKKYHVEDVQKRLSELGLYTGKIDGIHGDLTSQAIVSFQLIHPPLTTNGKVSDKLLQELFPEDIEERQIQQPKAKQVAQKNTNAYPHQNDVKAFYGLPGQHQKRITLPYPMRLAWDLNKTKRTMSCHQKVADSMLAILTETLAHYGLEKIKELGLDRYGGCLNIRKMRGGNRYSMHSWGIAFDIDPAANQFRWNSKKAKLAGSDYDAFWEIVEKHGATSLGRERDYDWMHFQFAHL